jgi:dolichol-phosphate mannosyltransferase
MKTISIIVPVYFNELNIDSTVQRLMLLPPQRPDINFEFIFVDDGSEDNSLNLLIKYKNLYPKSIRIVKLARNFGTMAAIQAGFSVCKGDFAGFIAADLQDPPELFLKMLQEVEKGKKVCLAVRSGRNDPLLQKIFASFFYFLLRRFALKNYPKKGFDFLLIDRQVVDHINLIKEKNSNIMNLIFWMGYEFASFPYIREERSLGVSKWTFSKRVKLFIDSFVGFSYFPIRLISVLGIGVSVFSFTYLIFIVINWYAGRIPIQGWTTTIVFVALISGVQMLILGVLGEYLWRTLDQVKTRPMFIIDKLMD